MSIPFHPYADIFPLIEGAEFDGFVEDIRQNGVRDPIFIFENAILDGRNRYRACQRLLESGAPLGAGWGVWADAPMPDDHLDISALQHPFRRYIVSEQGDPLRFVISKNLHRRHLNDIQRASIAGKIANLAPGRPQAAAEAEETPPIGGVSAAEAAVQLNVAPRQVERARVVHELGAPEVREALDRGEIAVSAAERIARLPQAQQPEAVRAQLPNGARAIMSSRQEPDDSLDFFPTPPWATRALIEVVLRQHLGVTQINSAFDPACGEGHIAEVLAEYVPPGCVVASDIFDYGYGSGGPEHDYLLPLNPMAGPDWVITNPPFGEKTEPFVLRALREAGAGVAMFVRLQWLETNGRYENVFRDNPPTLIAFFAERVNLCKGRWDPDGSTATAYIWLIWIKGQEPQAPFWIPPGQREALTHPDDRERFTAHPVISRHRPAHKFSPADDAEASADDAEESESDDGGELPPFLHIITGGDDAERAAEAQAESDNEAAEAAEHSA